MNKSIVIFSLAIITTHAMATELEDELKWIQAESTMIEVVSKKKETVNSAAGIVSVMTSDEITRYNARNLSELLNRITSIYAIGSSLFLDNIVSMRGDLTSHHSNHVLVLLNGRPVRDTYTGGLNGSIYRDFPIHAIDKLEVVRGPGSVLYGTNAFSGVVNIVTKKDKESSLTLRGGYGSFNTGRGEVEAAWKNEDVAMTAAVRYNSSDGWLNSAIGENEEFDKDKPPIHRNYNFRASDEAISGTFWVKWKDFTLNGFVASSERGNSGPLIIGSGEILKERKAFLDIGHQYEFTDYWRMQTNLTYNHLFSAFMVNMPMNERPIRLEANDLLFEQTHFFNFFENKLNFLIGGTVEWQNENQAPIYNHLTSSLYAEINYNLLPNLKLNAGGQWHRVERSLIKDIGSNSVVDGLVGRLGLVYQYNDNLGFKVLYSQAFRDPTTVELNNNVSSDIFAGNTNLQPEKVTTFDAQVFYTDKNYQLSLTAFRTKQSNLIERVPVGTVSQYQNTGGAIFEGLEFESKLRPLPNLQLTGSYTFQTNKNKETGKNNETPVPNHLAKMGISYDITPEWQMSIFDTFVSSAKAIPSAANVNPKAGNYHNLSLNTRFQLNNLLGLKKTKAITFSIYANNLLDEKIYYPEVANRKINTTQGSAGRTVFGELEIQF